MTDRDHDTRPKLPPMSLWSSPRRPRLGLTSHNRSLNYALRQSISPIACGRKTIPFSTVELVASSQPRREIERGCCAPRSRKNPSCAHLDASAPFDLSVKPWYGVQQPLQPHASLRVAAWGCRIPVKPLFTRMADPLGGVANNYGLLANGGK